MPRNGSGTYSLPSGNPVQSGTLIDATWANNTLNDIANELTDSLSRSGEGGMLAPFRLSDGVQATPGLAWTNEPSTGFYRAGTNEMWSVVGGTQVTQFTANGMAGRFAAGAVTTPSVTRLGDLNTGIYFPGADEFAIATGGVARMTFDSAGAVAIPGTLSVTGNVTVDTNTLFVDAANNRVGVGTVTPAVKLDVAGGVSIGSADNLTWGGAYGATTPAISGSAGFLAFYPNGSTSGELMRLNATGLGIGTSSPAQKLDVTGTVNSVQARFGNVAGRGLTIGTTTITGTNDAGVIFNAPTSSDGTLIFQTQSVERLRIDASGNAGLGVTPSAWTAKAIQVNARAAFWGDTTQTIVSNNMYASSGGDRYIATATAALYAQSAGQHIWFNAPSGTAGNAITFTQAMTLDASGDLTLPGTLKLGNGVQTIAAANTNDLQLNAANGSGNILFRAAGAERARITAAGEMLVGTTSSPAYGSKLRVEGGIESFSSQFNVSSGTSTQFELVNRAASAGFDFYVNSGGTLAARITSAGEMLVGTTNVSDAAGEGVKIKTESGGVAVGKISLVGNTAATNIYPLMVYSTSVANYRFYVDYDGSVYARNTSIISLSDQRLKENIRELDVGLDAVMALKPRKFDWKEGKGQDKKDVRGFIAQEFEQVFPDLVNEWIDPAPEGEEPYKTVRQDLIPVLVKAIQEQQAMIKALEAKVAALEAGV